VSAQFLHLPAGQRQDVYAGLAAAVAPGGRLLIVGHHLSDLHTTAHRVHLPETMFTADELAAGLDASPWEIWPRALGHASPRAPTASRSPSGTPSSSLAGGPEYLRPDAADRTSGARRPCLDPPPALVDGGSARRRGLDRARAGSAAVRAATRIRPAPGVV
jgi:hypothetical protein